MKARKFLLITSKISCIPLNLIEKYYKFQKDNAAMQF